MTNLTSIQIELSFYKTALKLLHENDISMDDIVGWFRQRKKMYHSMYHNVNELFSDKQADFFGECSAICDFILTDIRGRTRKEAIISMSLQIAEKEGLEAIFYNERDTEDFFKPPVRETQTFFPLREYEMGCLD
jgi:hypothetical protein